MPSGCSSYYMIRCDHPEKYVRIRHIRWNELTAHLKKLREWHPGVEFIVSHIQEMELQNV